jgi:hypothetical protein
MQNSKYAPLERHLSHYPTSTWRTRFSEIEKILGFPLPGSARRHRAWWSNNDSNNVMTRAWKSAGWETEQVDMENEALLFRRVGELGEASISSDGSSTIERNEARNPLAPRGFAFSFGRLKGTVTWRGEPTEPTGETWEAERGDAE